jgi:hypothetical protein
MFLCNQFSHFWVAAFACANDVASDGFLYVWLLRGPNKSFLKSEILQTLYLQMVLIVLWRYLEQEYGITRKRSYVIVGT